MIDERATNVIVRLATLDDGYAAAFLSMVAAYLHELREMGSEVMVTERTLDFWDSIFEMYIEQPDTGVVLVAVDRSSREFAGFTMAGAMSPEPAPIDTDFGKTAIGHGTYVKPQYRGRGISSILRASLKERLALVGFTTLVGGVHLENARGIASLRSTGFTAHQILGYERL